MEWSTDKPIKEGIYWAAKKAHTIPATNNEWDIDLVKIEYRYPSGGYKALGWETPDNKLEFSAFGDECGYDLDYYEYWIGPLEKPDPPWTIL